MPKRIATPPPGDHEPKFLAVHYPFPYMANMEVVQDRMNVARWVACIIPKDHLWSIHHKPSAPNTVILEISCEFTEWGTILGEHKASAFLRNPGNDADRFTRVFFSTLSNTREVEKAGWKRIDIVEEWFNGFDRKNRIMAFPYPKTTYCDLPTEDRTNRGLWRPLPTKYFPHREPEQKTAPAPPVGSSGWVDNKTAEPKPKDPPTSPDASLSNSSSDPITPQDSSNSGEQEPTDLWEPAVPRWGTLGKDSAVIPQDGLCPVHGTRCRKGICDIVGKAKRPNGPTPSPANKRPAAKPQGSQAKSPQRSSQPGKPQRTSYPGSPQRSTQANSPTSGNTPLGRNQTSGGGAQGGNDQGPAWTTVKERNTRGPQTPRDTQAPRQSQNAWRKS